MIKSKFANKININRTSAVLLSVMALILPACTSEVVDNNNNNNNTTLEDVNENTEQLIGQTVTIRSEYEEMVGGSVFRIDDDQYFGGEEVLVINATGTTFVVPTDYTDQIQVTGEVQPFVRADIERDYNLTLDPNLYVEYEGKPAIIAQSLALAPDPGELTDNPEVYYNQTIAVQGEVENIYDPTTFSIDEDQLFGGDDLLVVNTLSSPEVNENEAVVVVGVLRPYIQSEFERDYNLEWDLDLETQIEAEYSQKPVLAATGIYPSAVEE